MILSRTSMVEPAPSAVAPGGSGAITLSATVSGSSPTGTITWLDGTTLLGSTTLVSGSATLSMTFSTPGTHIITVSYSGDAHNAPSSTTQTLTVLIPPEQLIPILQLLDDDQ